MSTEAIGLGTALENAKALSLPNDVFNQVESLRRAILDPTPPPLQEIRTAGEVVIKRLREEAEKGTTKDEKRPTFGDLLNLQVLSRSARVALVTKVARALEGYIEERERESSRG